MTEKCHKNAQNYYTCCILSAQSLLSIAISTPTKMKMSKNILLKKITFLTLKMYHYNVGLVFSKYRNSTVVKTRVFVAFDVQLSV